MTIIPEFRTQRENYEEARAELRGASLKTLWEIAHGREYHEWYRRAAIDELAAREGKNERGR